MDGYDVAVRIARLGLASSGEGVGMLEQYVNRTAAAYDLDVTMVVLPEQIVLQLADPVAPRSTVVRAAPGIFRLDQVAGLKRTLVAIEGGLDPDTACQRLDDIATQRPRWPWCARIIGVALFAVGFAPSVVASWGEVAASAVLGLLMGVMVVATAGTKLEGLVPFVGAFVVTVVGVTMLSGLATETGVVLLVIPALFITVPGDTLSAAAGELLSGRLTPGVIRLMLGLFILGLIVIGIVAAADVTGHLDALSESLPAPNLPYPVLLLGWVVFSAGLVLAFNAELPVFLWLVPSVVATYLLQQGATLVVGSVLGTLVAGSALGAFANLLDADPRRPPRLILILGGFFVLTVGGLGVRGVTAFFGGDPVSSLHDLADFGLQVPTVAVSLALGIVLSQPWRTRLAGTPNGSPPAPSL